jgi:hypothetical protein
VWARVDLKALDALAGVSDATISVRAKDGSFIRLRHADLFGFAAKSKRSR